MNEEAVDNPLPLRLVYTDELMQVAVVCVQAGASTGDEVHEATSQTVYVVEGEGMATLDGTVYDLYAGDSVFVPAGTVYDLANTGKRPLRMFAVYAGAQLHAED